MNVEDKEEDMVGGDKERGREEEIKRQINRKNKEERDGQHATQHGISSADLFLLDCFSGNLLW